MIVAIITRKHIDDRTYDTCNMFSDARTLLEFWEKIKKKKTQKGVKFEYFTVNRTKASSPPKEYAYIKEEYWCPYCRSSREFTFNHSLDVHICEICRVSTRDFYVRKHNKLDPSWEELQRMRKA